MEKNTTGQQSYYDITPETAINLDFNQTIQKLKDLISPKTLKSIFEGKTIDSPVKKLQNSHWLEQSKIIGINPRAIGTYFDMVKYAMTFPEESIHILPLFEQGCQNSLYAPVNFKLSDEFMDKDLTKLGYDTPEKQLKLTVNLLHALGKNVGMDFLQHTDRFSEEVFVNPDNFIWAKLNKNFTRELEYPEIHPDKVSEGVKDEVVKYLRINGDSNGKKISETILKNFYSFNEDKRREILFGNNDSKTKRRIELMDFVRNAHYETKPLSVDSPARKIVFKEMHNNNGITWADFTDYQNDNIFGNLAAYKLYHLDENGIPDTNKPNKKVWDFIIDKNSEFVKEYGFDFLRADMGYLSFSDSSIDIHSKLKDEIQKQGIKHFASLGECFCGFSMSDKDGIKRKNYDAVLGNLQYKNVNDEDFVNHVKCNNFNSGFKISNGLITADSDQACYNNYYDNFQNKIRAFMGFFLNQPSYMGMGLETRDVNPTEGKYFTKDFINDWGIDKYEWGKNKEFFGVLSSMRKIYSKIKDIIQNQYHYWLNTNDNKVASWFYYSKDTNQPSFFFACNTSNDEKTNIEVQNIFDTNMAENINKKYESLAMNEVYSTKPKKLTANIIRKGKPIKLTNLGPGECRIYKVINPEKSN